MCGITGVYAFSDDGRTCFSNVKKSVESLALRGPDSNGILEKGNACLGHSRLSIIDLSNAASQPFCDITKRYSIIFNGEIFNYKELRADLIKKGIPLKTQSDTEVLLYLYITEGVKCLDKLNGFFSFAIYDMQEDTIFIARDRMGIKPLLYFHDGHKLLFASEMKALVALGIPKEIDKTSVSQYFQFNYIPSTDTIFKNVKKLAPGHYLFVENKQLTEKVYYSIPYDRNDLIKTSYSDSKIHLQHIIQQSVQKRMVSDVPLGAFLSGGIDSSIIVAEASKFTNKLNTFSIGYKDEAFFDETFYAELVAKKFKTNHKTFKLSNDDLYENLHKMLDYIDEPFADSSALVVNILSMYTRKHATVALSGDGADELFSGYNKHKAHYNAINKGFKSSLVKVGMPLWRTAPKSRNSRVSNTFRQLERYSQGLSLEPKDRYWYWSQLMSQGEVNNMLNFNVSLNELKARKHELVKHILPEENVSDILYTDMNMVLVGDMLRKVDSMSMANSLEVRTPFLDHELVNYVFSLPEKFKITAKMRKRILQDTYRDVLPKELYQRPKQGFEVPLTKWFKTELKDELLNNYLNRDYLIKQNIFNIDVIDKLKMQLLSKNSKDIQAHLWALLVFQHWWKKYMD